MSERLRGRGWVVETARDGAAGAALALSHPPTAVVADLWMQGVSGVQLTRLLRSEAATADVPVILCDDRDDRRSRFWAERAGAYAFVPKRRPDVLVATLTAATRERRSAGALFLEVGDDCFDIRDRIAQHLDAALFDSVIAAEVRALASAGSVDRVFDGLAQLLAKVVGYRWLAMAPFGLPRGSGKVLGSEALVDAARHALGVPGDAPIWTASGETFERTDDHDPPTIVRSIDLGSGAVGRLAVACGPDAEGAPAIVGLIAHELGGPLCVATLVEETQRLANTDQLTGLLNRRAFFERTAPVFSGGGGAALLLLDVDHFKRVNDGHGHAVGDRVLSSLGDLLRGTIRITDVAARWGGEEIVLLLPGIDPTGAQEMAERVRRAVEESLVVLDDGGARVPITVSAGLGLRERGESLDHLVMRADRAMYEAKGGGRNRVVVAPAEGALAGAIALKATLDDVAAIPPFAA